jgi:PAS domain S-box-containing protein
MLKAITIMFLALVACQVQAQEHPHKRVLVLHGVWKSDVWEGNFDEALQAQFDQVESGKIAVSFRYLGLDSELGADAYAHLKTDIEDAVRDHSVDLVIGVLSAATRFLVELESAEDILKILIVPDPDIANQVKGLKNVGVISSSADEAISATIEQILILRPNTKTIEVISGSSENDLAYMQKTRALAQQFLEQVNFNFYSGRNPKDVFDWAAGLDSSSAILRLPYESFGEIATPVKIDVYRELEQRSTVPVFGFYDSQIGTGIVGGHLTSTAGYVNAAAQMTRTMLKGMPPNSDGPYSSATTQYDWRQVQKWDLPLNRLQQPYEILFKPPTLWDTNRTLVITVANTIFLLVALSIFLGLLLRRSRHAQIRIAASERQARLSEHQYRLLAFNSVDVIWSLNARTKTIDYCSPSIKALTGFIPEQYTQKKLTEIMTPESVSAFETVISRDVPKADLIEIQHYTNAGETIWCEVALQPTQEKSEDDLWVAVSRDISQRIIADRERVELEEKIRQTQKFESLGTLAGGIAHDFNNILGIFVGVAEMLETKLTDNKPALDLVKRLKSAIDRAKSLVNQILTFSRQSKGKKAAIDLVEVLKESLSLITVGIPKRVKITSSIDAQKINILANATQIEQIILNLVTNAYESIASDNGEIAITLSEQTFEHEQQFRYGTAHRGRYGCLEVQDNGVGMTSVDLDRAFDPFYTQKALGSGMGLAIVLGIAMEHEACIDVESMPGSGTKFTLYFPVSDQEKIAAQARLPAIDSARSLRILAIEDQRELLDVLKQMLQEMGHECIACATPEDSLQLIKDQHQTLDLIITDYSMPEITGMDIIRYCDENHLVIPVILCSGYGARIPKEFLANPDRCLFINKPIDMRSLQGAISQLIKPSRKASA